MKWSNVVRLILLALAPLGIISFCTLDFDYRESRIGYEPDELTVSIGRSWDTRTLAVEDRQGERVEVNLISEWGPELRTNLYQTEEGRLGIIDFGGTWKVLQSPLRLERVMPSEQWEYLGTFLRDRYKPKQTAEECMDILLDEPPPPIRSRMYRRRC